MFITGRVSLPAIDRFTFGSVVRYFTAEQLLPMQIQLSSQQSTSQQCSSSLSLTLLETSLMIEVACGKTDSEQDAENTSTAACPTKDKSKNAITIVCVPALNIKPQRNYGGYSIGLLVECEWGNSEFMMNRRCALLNKPIKVFESLISSR